MLKGFKEFILRGNVVELATAVIIGAAFNSIVESFTGKVLEPLINSIPGGDPAKAAEGLGFCVGGCRFANPNNANQMEALNYVNLGAVITAAINFLIVASVIYFLIILPYNKLAEMFTSAKDDAETEVSLLTEIRNLMDPEAAARAEAEKAEKDRTAAFAAEFDRDELPPPGPLAGGPFAGGALAGGALAGGALAGGALAGGEPMIRPSAGPPSGVIPRYDAGGYPTGSQPPIGGYPTGSQAPLPGGYPTGSQPPIGGAYPPPPGYPGGETPAPGGFNAPGAYQPPPFPGPEPELPGDHPGRHSR